MKSEPATNRIRVLIVDDKENNLYLLRVLLQGEGYEVVSAVNGAEALEKARKNPPCLIIADILMPVMDGYALCREWKMDELLKSIPFVFYTATYTDDRDRDFALSLGAERFVVKPMEPDELMSIIREVIEQAGNLREVKVKTGQAPPRSKAESAESEENGYLKQYSEVLIRKLEAKMMQLEKANRELEQDIILRKRTEDELAESEERFRHLAENALDIIFRVKLDPPSIKYVSPSIEKIFGYTPKEAYSDFNILMKIIAEDYHQWLLEYLSNPEDQLSGFVVECRHRDGSQRWIEVNSRTILDENGKAVAIENIARDVTERIIAEKELAKSEENFRGLIEHSGDAIYVLQDNRFVFVNPKFETLFRISVEDVRAEEFDFQTLISPESLELIIERERRRQRGESVSPMYEFHARRKDGSYIDVEASVNEVTFQGKPAVLGILRDISERKQAEKILEESEERFRTLIEEAPDGIFVHSEGEFVFLNSAMLKLYGAEKAEDLAGKGPLADIAPEYREAVSKRMQAQNEIEGAASRMEMDCLRLDGTRFPVETTGVPLQYQGHDAHLVFVRDISERKQAEKTLAESEERFRSLIEKAPEGIFVQSEERFAFLNPAMLKLVGASKTEDLLGSDIFSIIAPEYREAVAKRIQIQSETRAPVPVMDQEYLRLDGTRFPVETIAVPIQYRDHDAHLVFVRDISERKQAEKTLADSEERFRTLIEDAPEGIFVHSERQFDFLNKAMLSLIGAEKAEDMLGKEIFSVLAPEYREAVSKRIQARTEIGKIAPPMEMEFLRLDGTRVPLETTGVLIKFQGHDAHLVFVRDISERKQADKSQAWMTQSLDASPLAAIMVDPEGKTHWVNQLFKTMFGFSSEEVVGKPFISFLDLTTSSLEKPEQLASVLSGKEGRWYGAVPVIAKDGEKISTYLAISSVKDSEGTILGSIVKLLDRRPLKELESAKIRLENELNQQFHLSQVGLLTSGFSHNLRSPLSVIIMVSTQIQQNIEKVLQESPEDPFALYEGLDNSSLLLEKVKQASDRINLIIDELMAYHQMNTQADGAPIDLNNIIRTDVGLLKADMDIKQKIEMDLNLLPGHLWVKMRPSEISQIFLNLTANARDAMNGAAKRVMTIRSGVSDDSSEVWFEVQDTGVGMPQEIREKIGQPFITTKREDPKMRKCGSGTGLGLYMIKRLLSDHGGRLEVESEPGDTRIRVHLTAAEPPVEVVQ